MGMINTRNSGLNSSPVVGNRGRGKGGLGPGAGPGRPKNRPGPKKPTAPKVKNPPQSGTDQPYANTDIGEIEAGQNPEDYYQYLLTKAGRGPGGETPFDKWLDTSYQNMIMQGFTNAKYSGNGALSFRDYMANFTGVNTGNPYTSSSGPHALGSAPTFQQWLGQTHHMGPKRYKQIKPVAKTRLQNAYDRTTAQQEAAASAASGIGAEANAARMLQMGRDYYRALTPEQRGEYTSGYSYGPARWSVFG